ncbi:phenylacetate--CoA ligase family protein [Geobacter anodireducens]|uniref:Phenylacetate--CoA ligase family protein n=1 Tax=Geobacter anodireducens TaxID=1340425 RepID=A0ABR9NR56_9BACT|nr:phenylacetate--CoA ligase family protein [Geobacter anodireducens]MBE2886743.1 phenylacetate--CoA ligase family protein [Geobacter anodireducens]
MLKHRLFSPLRRHLMEPLDALRSGTPFLNYWKELERTQYLPEAALRRVQWERLTDLLAYVWDNNQFYRERMEQAGLTPETVTSPEEFRKIPVLSKECIRQNTLAMISRGYDVGSLMKFKTGGSTGKSLEIYLTEECSERRNACARRHDRWAGWNPGEPIGAVWGNPELPRDMKSRIKDWFLSPVIYLDTMSVTEASVRAFAAEWEQVQPTLLYGHAHSIFVLAEFVRDLRLNSIAPKGILSTSMMLMPHERRTIESVFGIKVTDRYGCEEVSLIASECERHEGMHLNIEHLYIEFLREDGSPASPGEPGTIVVTDLMNRAMPFIRYRVEDVGVLSGRKCRCGRGLPLMESVTGRVADFLIKKDGSRVAGVSLIENTLTKMPGIVQMQIVQESMDSLIVRVVPGAEFKDSTQCGLRDYLAELFGSGTSVEVSIVDAIAPEASGKYRFSICRIS